VNALGRAARSFGDFWWDFLIGDTPEIVVAVVVIIVAALLLRHHHAAALIVLPTLVMATLVTSVLRARKPK
jgi:glucose dehydrogenase